MDNENSSESNKKTLRIVVGSGQDDIDQALPPRESVVIGRSVECDVVIKDVKASRMHCRLTKKEEGYELEDLESKNGTFVDGKRIEEPILLQNKQTFKIGDTMFYLS